MIFPDFSRLRILVVGDLMIDRYIYGAVDRISPEAPVPVVRPLRRQDRLGGAANVALNLSELGVGAEVAGAVGSDEGAAVLRGRLSERGIACDLLVGDAERPTTIKTRVIAQRQQLLRIDEERTDDLDEANAEHLIGAIQGRLGQGNLHGLVLQDYNKGVLTPTVIEGVLSLAQDRSVYTAVDPKQHNFWAYRGASLFKPNLREISAQLDFAVDHRVKNLDRAAAEIFARTGCREVMITLSEHGIYANDGQRSQVHPTRARKIADVSGAGDTVISVAASGRAAGLNLHDCARLANLAGAQVIARSGVATVSLDELRAAWLAR